MTNGMYSSKTDEWATPEWLFEMLNEEFEFTLDPCSTDENAKCKKHYTKVDDGLSKSWDGERVFCNPPYGRQISRWVRKACYSRALTVMLLPARTDTAWFHDYIYENPCVKVRFLRGRIKFVGGNSNAPFPSMVVIFDGITDEVHCLRKVARTE